jgi:hypothetical protein
LNDLPEQKFLPICHLSEIFIRRAPDRTCPEQLSDNEQFLDLVRFDQRNKLDELPAEWKRLVELFMGHSPPAITSR